MAAWKALAAFAIAVGAFAVYTFGWHDSDGRPTATRHHVITLREGDVVVRPEAAARCQASQEGGSPNLFCTRVGGGRHQIIFYSDSVWFGHSSAVRTGHRSPTSGRRTYSRPTALGSRSGDSSSGTSATWSAIETRSVCSGRRRCVGSSATRVKRGRRGHRLASSFAYRRSAAHRPARTDAAPGAIYVHSALVSGKQWQTLKGLRVGLPADVVRQLYPDAIFQRRPAFGQPRPAYWIVHVRQRCLVGICTRRYETVPRLTALVRGGRVSGFFFPVGAEGE